jgi:hypothetical protein
MPLIKNTLVGLCLVVLIAGQSPAKAAAPDFNADRRVNIKCPSSIDKDRVGQFELDGFKQTIRRLYHEHDGNLSRAAKESKDGYAFSANPKKGAFFVCHAKAALPAGRLPSLAPQDKIAFQEVFFVTDIDWKNHQVQLVRQRGRKKFSLGVNDFEKGFIWYNALLDKEKAYIPVYGFLSLPGDARAFPTLWNSWEADRQDMATPRESLIDCDFYKILDFRGDYYLLGQDFNELDYRGNVEDYGIIGWVEKKYITLWRSRLYYNPQQRVSFYNDARTEIVEKLDQESLHRFYTHFGFPQLGSPEYFNKERGRTRVFIPGAFTPRRMCLLARSMKKNLNTFFLLDVSKSMRPFADYVMSFNTAVRDMKHEGIGLRVNRTFAYWDSAESDEDLLADPNFIRIKRPEQIKFHNEGGDRNYTEPLMRALIKVLNEIETLQAEKTILPLHQKLLFIITDAGPNDLTDEVLAETFQRAKALNLSIYFIYPKESGIRPGSPSLVDTPAGAYADLKALMARYEAGGSDGQMINVRQFQFEKKVLQSKQAHRKYFVEHQAPVPVPIPTQAPPALPAPAAAPAAPSTSAFDNSVDPKTALKQGLQAFSAQNYDLSYKYFKKVYPKQIRKLKKAGKKQSFAVLSLPPKVRAEIIFLVQLDLLKESSIGDADVVRDGLMEILEDIEAGSGAWSIIQERKRNRIMKHIDHYPF